MPSPGMQFSSITVRSCCVTFDVDWILACMRLDDSDIVQDALTLANRDLNRYRQQPHVPFFAWLRQVASRQVLRASEQHIKTQKRTVRKERNLEDPECWKNLATLSTPSHAAMRDELYEKLESALQTLSVADRNVLELRFYRRLNGKEAAAALGISETASRKRLSRALERLETRLQSPCGRSGSVEREWDDDH